MNIIYIYLDKSLFFPIEMTLYTQSRENTEQINDANEN